MTITDLAEVEKLADRLRAKGVKTFEGYGVKLELGPVPDDGKPVQQVADADKCRCGHMVYAHQEGMCTLGCDAERCLDGETERKLEAAQ